MYGISYINSSTSTSNCAADNGNDGWLYSPAGRRASAVDATSFWAPISDCSKVSCFGNVMT